MNDRQPRMTTGARGRTRNRVVALSALGVLLAAGAAAVAISQASAPAAATAAPAAASEDPSPAVAPTAPSQERPEPWGSWSWPDPADRGSATGGKITSIGASSITVTAANGATATVSTDASTAYEQLTKSSAAAIKTGEHLLAFGDGAARDTKDPSVVVIGSNDFDPWTARSPAGWGWGPWSAMSGTVSSVSGNTLAVKPAMAGSVITLHLSGSTIVVSAHKVAATALRAGDDALVEYDNGRGSPATGIIFSDQSLSSLGLNYWPLSGAWS